MNAAFPAGAAPSAQAEFVWPDWAHTARIAGAYFTATESAAVVDARLAQLAAEHVSVVVADSPLGEQYGAWVDDDCFASARALIARMVALAHSHSLKVVLYLTGLEFISAPGRNPLLEHPEWVQHGLDGRPILYSDVSNDEEHWLHTGIWDFWAHPCGREDDPQSLRALAFASIRALVRTGIDGLWIDQVYLQSSVGSHHDLWPSGDPCSAAAFQAATGFALPPCADWDDPVFRRWVVWRHGQLADYLQAVASTARAANPHIVVFNENSCADTARATYVGADPASLLGVSGIATAHELETIADRMDSGETGMQSATLAQWLAFRTMVAFARAVDRGKPTWILTYGYAPHDSARLAGLTLAEGANFYETRGPQMAASVGSDFRTQLFTWIADHEAAFYASTPVAEVGLLYSPRTRDLLDMLSGQPYAVQDSHHFAAYRGVAHALYSAHIPFDVVLDTDLTRFARYRVLIAPRLELMSDATTAALHAFDGKLITVGTNGSCDEWLERRATPALHGRALLHVESPSADLAHLADTGLLATTAPAAVQIGLRRVSGGWQLVLVNTSPTPPPAFTITLRSGCIPSGPSATEPLALACTAGAALFVPPGESPNGACDARTGAPLALPVTVGVQNIAIHVPAGSEIDSGLAALGLITVTCPPQAPGCRRRGIT